MPWSPQLQGREEVVDSAVRSLADPCTRVLTLTGLPGVGTTSVARTAFARHRATWPASSEPSSVAAQALSLVSARTVEAPGELSRRVVDAMAVADVVLVDDADHSTQAASELLVLLDSCVDLRLIVTARAPLHVPGESVVRVPPLPDPDPDLDLELYAVAPAVRVFLDAARRTGTAAELSGPVLRDVAAICVRLGGNPRAIELAAAMTATLCPATLLARLERSAPSRVITSRHHLDRGDARLVLEDPGGKECHELFRAIRRSTTLLGDRAQALLSALAVFHSPATLDAIEAVTGRPIDLDGLSELVEAHLVDPTHGSGGSRYRLPALVRESATELLEAQPGRADELRARHTEWAASVAQESRDLEDSGRRDSALALVAAVEADLVAALVRVTDFASSTGAPGRTGSSWSSAPHAPHGTDGMAPVIRLTPSLGAGGLDRPLLQDLTEREREVLTSMTSGATNKELSGLLGISAKTVMHHTSSIYRKLGVRGRSEAVAWALRNPYAVPAPTGSPHRAERGARRERLSAKGI